MTPAYIANWHVGYAKAWREWKSLRNEHLMMAAITIEREASRRGKFVLKSEAKHLLAIIEGKRA
jgi:hypothetical protein